MLNPPELCSTTVCYPLSVSPSFSLARALESMARCGLSQVEIVAIPGYCPHIEPDRMNEQDVTALRALLDSHGLTAVAVNVAADLTTESGVAYLVETMRVAQALDVRTVVSHIEQAEDEAGAVRFENNVAEIARQAESHDVVVALETHGGLISTGQQGVSLLKRLGAERIKLTYDMANVVFYGGVRPEEDLAPLGADIGRYVAHVHLKDKANMQLRDYNFPTFGQGILDFGAVLNLLHAGGYRGPYSLEVELDGQPATPELVDASLAASKDYLQQFWVKGGENATA